jgi:hypothetical protein
MTPAQGSGCSYNFDVDVHCFVFHKANAAAVGDFLHHLQRILNETPRQDVIRLLIDLRPEGLPPIGYAYPSLKRLFSLQSRQHRFKSAYLYRRGTLVHILPTFLDLILQRVIRRFFLDGEEAEAVRWLREG